MTIANVLDAGERCQIRSNVIEKLKKLTKEHNNIAAIVRCTKGLTSNVRVNAVRDVGLLFGGGGLALWELVAHGRRYDQPWAWRRRRGTVRGFGWRTYTYT